MGLLDIIRSNWKSVCDKFTDPVKMAKLNLADLKKLAEEASACSAETIGTPIVLREKISKDKAQLEGLDKTIRQLLSQGKEQQAEAYLKVYNETNARLSENQAELAEAEVLSQDMLNKIRFLNAEIAKKEKELRVGESQLRAAQAEVKMNKSFSKVEGLLGTDTKAGLNSEVDKMKAKAAGMSAMSGLEGRMATSILMDSVHSGLSLDAFRSNPVTESNSSNGASSLSDFK